MYLCELRYRNFRNFKSAYFNFKQGTNTVIGENDSGKTNALTGLRFLFDDSFFYGIKRLRESDFSYDLDNWKGHWIIISADFCFLAEDEKREICGSMTHESRSDDKTENLDSIRNLTVGTRNKKGSVTLFIRPNKAKRKELFNASGKEENFNKIRNSINLTDYELYFTAKSDRCFQKDLVYKSIVGDLNANVALDPESDDNSLLGTKIDIADVRKHLSLAYIDALRDVSREMSLPRNPIRKIIECKEDDIDTQKISDIQAQIKDLNSMITSISQVTEVNSNLNDKLLSLLGVIYSPELALSSELSDEITKLSRFIAMKPKDDEDLELLGLGHLNMIYVALKILEFEVCRQRELLNIMIIEEPEAHIQSHIQKTIFNNLKTTHAHTQVIMSTHSVHLSEASEISRMNILKKRGKVSIAMQPVNKIDEFGEEKLNIGEKSLVLSKCIERYLDAKRSVLLFSKGVLLVEGDAEEILIPNMVKAAYGVTLDEMGIGLVNVGSTAFEYVASLFDESRIQKYCAVLTDKDKQSTEEGSSLYNENSEKAGLNREKRLNDLYKDNNWVKVFYAPHTFEIEFVNAGKNHEYVCNVVEKVMKKDNSIKEYKDALSSATSARNEKILALAQKVGKGWLATILSNELNCCATVPEYIEQALAFASQETVSLQTYKKMLVYSLSFYEEETKCQELREKIMAASSDNLKSILRDAINTEEASDNVAISFVRVSDKYSKILS